MARGGSGGGFPPQGGFERRSGGEEKAPGLLRVRQGALVPAQPFQEPLDVVQDARDLGLRGPDSSGGLGFGFHGGSESARLNTNCSVDLEEV